MILCPKQLPHDSVILLFGHGLVGQAVTDNLRKEQKRVAHHITYNWQDNVQRASTRERLFRLIGPEDRVQIIWSAGRAGFGSTAVEMAAETALLGEVLAFAAQLAERAAAVSFDFVSSAGGLYEGMTGVTSHTVPQPRRPYGLEKIAQETQLAQASADAGFVHRVYRLSSIYGFSAKARLGLVPALIMNALNSTVTPITGNVNTLRDYVFAPDIGAFVVSQLGTTQTMSRPYLLASGKSISVADIISFVGVRLQEPLLLDYQQIATNNAHMSFDPDSLPQGWHPIALEDGVDRTIALVRQHFNQK